ncbi:MAG: histidine--tRNA ligase [Patescibacteria group bacterium]
MSNLSTDPYKGVRDFYPDDMAVQRYMFDVWSQTAESFGFERYDASVLEPADLYKAKGAENEEMVNEQTYTFTDRGDREVTLRPEMTPTVARMIAGKQRELKFPVRWYSIPNLFRYERAQRGRLREHWQLNCDIFGSDDFTADVEMIALAYQIFMNFGADESMFGIKVNSRAALDRHFAESGITDSEQIKSITNLIDRKNKMEEAEFTAALRENAGTDFSLPAETPVEVQQILDALRELGIENAEYDPAIVRGFSYYTGTVFELFDTDPENNRAMLGGGRYDNLTALFSNESVSGVGFGFGDVTMRNFLESHNLMNAGLTSPTLMIMPMEAAQNLEAQKIAQQFRQAGVSVAVDMSDRKIGKKLSNAGEQFVDYALVLGEDEVGQESFSLKNLTDGEEISGSIEELVNKIL